jgi:hypothetical protein
MANFKGDNAAENILATVAKVLLVLGLVVTVIFTIAAIAQFSSSVNLIGRLIAGLIILAVGVVFCFVIWASYMVIINISNNVRDSRRLLEAQNKLLEQQSALIERQNQLLEGIEKKE